MIYGSREKWESMPADAWPDAIARQEAFNAKYRETGELLGAYGLADAVNARLVRGGTSYTFVTDGIKAAVEQARAVADGKDVLVAGGVSIARQALAAGLADELVLHVVPVLVGRGVRLFGSEQADLRCVEVISGEGALHLRYEVR